jgi:hypothetical protein
MAGQWTALIESSPSITMRWPAAPRLPFQSLLNTSENFPLPSHRNPRRTPHYLPGRKQADSESVLWWMKPMMAPLFLVADPERQL